MEDAPNATDHDDDSKRIASSYSYDLPNQEQDNVDDIIHNMGVRSPSRLIAPEIHIALC